MSRPSWRWIHGSGGGGGGRWDPGVASLRLAEDFQYTSRPSKLAESYLKLVMMISCVRIPVYLASC